MAAGRCTAPGNANSIAPTDIQVSENDVNIQIAAALP